MIKNFPRMAKILALTFLAVLLVVGVWLWFTFRAGRENNIPKVEEKSLESRSSTVESSGERNLENGDLREDAPLVSSLVQNLEIPWSMDFLPDGSIIFTERPGRVRFIDPQGNLRQQPLLTINSTVTIGESGLLGVALHPNFSSNNFVYLYFSTNEDGSNENKVVRYTFNRSTMTLERNKEIIGDIPFARFHDGGRIKFGPDGYLYITTGDALEEDLAQDGSSLAGKILRVTADGSVPADNPFPGSPLFTLGHRNSQGIAWTASGELYATEHGNNAQDEVNRIVAGENYGWPVIRGPETNPEMRAPVIQSGSETWAPTGMAYSEERDSLFFTGLRGQSLFELPLDRSTEGSLKTHFHKKFGRLRSVVKGPDGFLYLLTNNRDGRGIPTEEDDQIIRINPLKIP